MSKPQQPDDKGDQVSEQQASHYFWLAPKDMASGGVDQLRNMVDRYQRILNGSGYGMWEWDLESDRLYWHGSFWRALGYTPESPMDVKSGADLAKFMHPDDVPRMTRAVQDHIKHHVPYDFSYRILTPNGDYQWTQTRGEAQRDADGQVRYLSGVNFDISELKRIDDKLRESEARHERIIDASNDGIWEWSRIDKQLDFSNRCWEQLGFRQDDDVLTSGRNRLQVWYELMHPSDLPRFKSALLNHIENQQPFDIEYRMRSVEGRYRWIRGRGTAAIGSDGQVISMAGSNMDITLLKEAEERIVLAKEAAETANRAKSEFLSSMSHELRTPLNAIMGFAQLFDYDSNLQDEQLENIREIRKAGTHLLQLINDVLDLAKIESGKLTLSLEPVLPSRVVRECGQLVQSLAESRAIKVSTDFRSWESTYIHADSVRLKQVLLNLLSNAIKYNRMGGSVEVIFQAPDEELMRIGVRDTGYGIPDTKRKDMYQPFSRLGAETSKIEGSGVGLVITRRLMEMMGGTIDFESRVGHGTTFWLTFNKSDQADAELHQPVREITSRAELALTRKHRILYIEDNPSNIRVLRQFCQRFEMLELDVAEEAFLGLYKARTFEPDLIILDINLPGMDGYEALEVIKTDPATSSIPVVALSANAMSYDIERGQKAGFDEYLTKPIDINALIHTLNRLLTD